jgi:hypothetical protein
MSTITTTLGPSRGKGLRDPLDQEPHTFWLVLRRRINNLQPRAASRKFLQKLYERARLQVGLDIPNRFAGYAVSISTPVPNQASVVRDSVSPDCDPSHLSIDQKRPFSIDCGAETHQNAFVTGKIIGMLQKSLVSQISRGGADDAPIIAEALDAQRTVRQFAIPDGKILSLPYKINVTICQVEIDGHYG